MPVLPTPNELPALLPYLTQQELAEMDRLLNPHPLPASLIPIKADPATIMTRAGLSPDPWQADFVRSKDTRQSLLCCRGAGKSTASAARALATALLEPMADVLLFSPTLRQSMELFRKVVSFWRSCGKPLTLGKPTKTELELSNGSRIISLPDNEEGVRGYHPKLVIIDEASRVSDALYFSVRPMLMRTRGSLIVLSTPFGKRGWFYEEWASNRRWERRKVTVDELPRYDRELLREERESLGARWYGQEYLCEYVDAIDNVFRQEDIDAALDHSVLPLFGPGQDEVLPLFA